LQRGLGPARKGNLMAFLSQERFYGKKTEGGSRYGGFEVISPVGRLLGGQDLSSLRIVVLLWEGFA